MTITNQNKKITLKEFENNYEIIGLDKNDMKNAYKKYCQEFEENKMIRECENKNNYSEEY